MSTERVTAELEDAGRVRPPGSDSRGGERVLHTTGIQRTSVQDVARMANVSRGTVYRYFEDRNVLIDAAIEFGAQEVLPESRRGDGQETDAGREDRRDGRNPRHNPSGPSHAQPSDG